MAIGSPIPRSPVNPFLTSAGGTGTLTAADLPFVLAPAPSGGDDYAVLQALMDANCPFGIGVRLRYTYPNAYQTSAELQHKSTYQACLSGAGASFNPGNGAVSGGTIIRATAAMRSVVAYLSPIDGQFTSGFVADANQFASAAIYVGAFGFSEASRILGINGLLDGWYIDGNSSQFVDGSIFRLCGAVSNGRTYATAGIQAEFLYGRKTTIAGTAQVTSGTTIDISGGTDLTTLSVRKGDHCRVGVGTSQALSALSSVGTTATATTATAHGLSDQQIVTIAGNTPSAYNRSVTITRDSDTQFSYTFPGAGVVTVLGTVSNPTAAQYAQIESVTATRITLQANTRNQMSTTAAGQEFAFGTGDGWHDNRTTGVQPGANSNSNTLDGGVWYSNGSSCIAIAGLFGDTINGGLIGFTSWYGVSLGMSDNAAVINQFEHTHAYFEGCAAGSIWFGQVLDPHITSVTWANQAIRHRGIYSNPGFIIGRSIEHIQFGVQQNFLIDLHMNGAQLEHRIISDWQSATVGAQVESINGAATGYTNTPSGATASDATHGFAAGGGVLAADAGVFMLDVSQQTSVCGQFTIEIPCTGIAAVYAYLNTVNVNGVTRKRLGFHAMDASGSGVALTAIPSGAHLVVRYAGYVNKS